MLENNFKILQKPNNNLNKKVLELLNHLISLPWYYFLYFILFSCILEEVRILKKAWENCVRIQSLNAFCSRWTSPRVLSLRALRAPWPAEQRNTSRSECFYCFGVFDTYFLSPELSVSVQVMIARSAWSRDFYGPPWLYRLFTVRDESPRAEIFRLSLVTRGFLILAPFCRKLPLMDLSFSFYFYRFY